MKLQSSIENLTEDFSVRIVKMCDYLKAQGKHSVICTQVYRSGTSIGANITEAHHAQSTADFISKMSIALKEADETRYWLNVLHRTNRLSERQHASITSDINEIRNKLAAIIRSTKRNNGLL